MSMRERRVRNSTTRHGIEVDFDIESGMWFAACHCGVVVGPFEGDDLAFDAAYAHLEEPR